MSKFKKIAILSMMLFLLTGCASQLKNGTVIVVEKRVSQAIYNNYIY